MNRLVLSGALALALQPAVAASPDCRPVAGRLQLTPDPGCAVLSLYQAAPASAQLPAGAIFLAQVGAPGACFSFTLRLNGLGGPFLGHAGLSSEPVVNVSGSSVSTPAAVPNPNFSPRQNILTARSTFLLQDTRVYAAEIILAAPGSGAPGSAGFVTEQSVSTGTSSGSFAGAAARLTVIGDSTAAEVPVVGEICLPRP